MIESEWLIRTSFPIFIVGKTALAKNTVKTVFPQAKECISKVFIGRINLYKYPDIFLPNDMVSTSGIGNILGMGEFLGKAPY
jgi:hypothetical protein